MGASTFTSTTNVTIKAGQAVTFEDPESGGGFHPLVIGTHGNHMATPGAPDELDTDEGVLFSPGTKMDITFYNPGIFPITCVAHPAMQATITVMAS
jgi:plastocyanin